MSNADLPAFIKSNINDCDFYGITKREYFAAMAMQGILSDADNNIAPNWTELALHSLKAADALIKALGGEK